MEFLAPTNKTQAALGRTRTTVAVARLAAALAALTALWSGVALTAAAGAAHHHPKHASGIGGYSVGPLPRHQSIRALFGHPRVIAGAPQVRDVRAGVIGHGHERGRVRVDATVAYPSLRRSWRRLISDQATYRAGLRVSLAPSGGGPTVGAATALTLPVRAEGQTRVRRQSVVFTAAQSRRLLGRTGATAGRPAVTARLKTTATYHQQGTGQPDDRVRAHTVRKLALESGLASAAQSSSGGAKLCTGPADLISPTIYYLDAHYNEPLDIQVCTTAATELPPGNWFSITQPLNGTAGNLRVQRGYITLTYRPNRGFVGEDQFKLSVNLPASGQYDAWVANYTIPPVAFPFSMVALGDSITAGFGFNTKGLPVQLNGDSNSFDAAMLVACKPPDNLNNRCSSNSNAQPFQANENGRWSGDQGLSNNLAWPAEFANWHGITSTTRIPTPFQGFFAESVNYQNVAVTGSEPKNWNAGGKFAGALNNALAEGSPDLTVMTAGANPLLGLFLTDGDIGRNCGSRDDISATTPAKRIDRASQCLRDQMASAQVRPRLRAIYRRLLDDRWNRVFIGLYPVAWPPMPFYIATNPVVNAYEPYVLDRLVSLINDEIVGAVEEENAAARERGQVGRLFVFAPPRFNLGAAGYAQAIAGSNQCDGPSNQSKALQDASAFLKCSGNDIYLESLDGVHLNRAGHILYANTLMQRIKQAGVAVPERPRALVNEIDSKCLDVPGANSVDQARLQMYSCNGSVAQQFEYTSSGELKVQGRCVEGTNGNQGSAVVINTCHGGVNQKWRFDDQSRIAGVGDRCIDIVDQNRDDGAKLHMWDCHGGPSQKWIGPGVP